MINTKKKSHPSSKLSIIMGYLFRSKFIYHSPLLEQGKATESHRQREGKHTFYIGIYRIKVHAQMVRIIE